MKLYSCIKQIKNEQKYVPFCILLWMLYRSLSLSLSLPVFNLSTVCAICLLEVLCAAKAVINICVVYE